MWVGLMMSGLFGSAIAEEARIEPEAGAAGGAGPGEPGEPGNLNFPGFEGKMPTAQQLLEVLDSMAGIPEDEKEKLKEDLLRNVKERAASAAEQAGFAAGSGDLTTQTIVLLSLLAIVALIFVFFLYKLFKCLSEREQKRAEKKRNKQLKKKK